MSIHPDLLEKILNFRDERDWAQFHNPKDLAAGLAIEAAELQEIFLWKDNDELNDVISGKKNELCEELADITWFLLLIAHELDIDLEDAVEKKLQKNASKYPVDRVKGSSKKYNDYTD